MTKLFITGATGYIGGDVLYAIVAAHPDLEITALVRNSEKGAKVAAQYAKIRLVYGDLDNTDLLKREASHADIVVHTANCDHVASAEALIAGLASSGRNTHLIHTSGTGILSFPDLQDNTYGVKREKIYNDWNGIGEVTSLPDAALHRNVDKIILGANAASGGIINTAIVCPPCIYGPGRGPDNQKSVQVYDYAKATLTRNKGFLIETGTNIWTQVHIQDLSAVYLALVTNALAPHGGATWNDQGYYFAENGEFTWGEVASVIAKYAFNNKLINSDELDTLDRDGAEKLRASGSYLWGTNSRCKSMRANKLFGWEPRHKSVFELIPDIIQAEAKELNRLQPHEEEAAA